MNRNEKIEYLLLCEEKAKRKARKNIMDFTQYTMPKYEANWHHELYAEKLDAFMRGEIKNLMVFMPPQHGKSELSTRRLPAKKLGDNPDLKIGLVAYNHTIAAKFNRDVQRIIETPKYEELYPGTSLNNQNVRTTQNFLKNSDEFEIVGHDGSLVSVGIGGSLTSRQLDILIMDDLYKDAQSAWSSTVRNNVQDWYETVARTRLHNDSQQLLVFTRWHEEDLAGHLLRTEPDDWEVVLFEAIRTDAKHEYDPREKGEALWPSKHSLDELLKIKENNPIVFEGLYQQNPTPKEGLLLPEADLKRFTMDMIKDRKPDGIISVADIADEGSDSMSQPVGYLFGKDVYIVAVMFTQDPIEITQPRSALLLDKYGVQRAVYESNNGGKGYAQKVKELKQGKTIIKWKHTSQNKHTKIIMASGIIKANFYFRSDIDNDKEYQKYIYELTHYPKNGKVKHDDAIDSTAQLENATNKNGMKFC